MGKQINQISEIALDQKDRIKAYVGRKVNIIKSSTLFAVNGTINHEVRKNLNMTFSDNSDFSSLGKDSISIENYMLLKSEEKFGKTDDSKINQIKQLHNSLGSNSYSNLYNYSAEEYINLFLEEKNYLTRKIIFEHFLLKYIDNFSLFRGLKYDQNIDYIFRNMSSNGENIFFIHIKSLKNKLENKNELRKFFQIYGLLLNDTTKKRNNFEIISDSLKIIIKNRDNLKYLDEEVLLRIIGKNEQKISRYKKSDRIYAKIPSVISDKHGEKNAAFIFLSNFVQSHRPSSLKLVEKQKNLGNSMFKDAENFKTIKAYLDNIKKWQTKKYSAVKSKIEPITSYIGDKHNEIKEQSSEKLFMFMLAYIRKNRNNNKTISKEEHKKLLLDFLSIKKYAKSIKNSQKINQAINFETKSSSTLKFIKSRLQVKALIPVINTLGKVKVISLASKSLKLIKIKNALWIGIYIAIDKLNSMLSSLPIFRRYSLIEKSYNGYNIESNPELMQFYIQNAGKIDDIGERVINLKKLRKLRKLEKILSNYELDLISLQEDKEISQSTKLGQNNKTDLQLEKLGKDISLLTLEIKSLKNELDLEKSSGEIRDSIKLQLSQILESTHTRLNSPLT